MPVTPAVRMRARAQQSPQRLSKEAKLKRREEREKQQSAISKPLIWFFVFIVLGSTVVQLYFSVVLSPKMKD